MVNKKITNKVTAEIERIYARDDGLKASVLVSEAKKKSSPLHGEFEWDDAKGAHQHRLSQARKLIRIVTVTLYKDGEEAGEAPMFVHVPSAIKEEGVYHTREVLANRPDLYMRALGETRTSLNAAVRAFKELERIAGESDKKENVLAMIGLAEKGISAAIECVKKIEAA